MNMSVIAPTQTLADQLTGWQHCELAELPRPNGGTMPCEGWVIGAIMRDGKLAQTYIQHPDHGAWLFEFEEPVECPDKGDRFAVGIATVSALDLPESAHHKTCLEIPINDRPVQEMRIPVGLVRTDGDTQRRFHLDDATIANYTTEILYGARFPNLKVVRDAESDLEMYWLYDGFHTRQALLNANATELICDVIGGTLEEAQDLAAGVNTRHGLPRSDTDKFATVRWAFEQERHRSKSDAAIARLCKVSPPFVKSVRDRLGIGEDDNGVRMVQRNGKTYAMTTGGIGKKSLQETQELYEPWGEFNTCWNTPNARFELRQRGTLICNFASTNEAWNQHVEVTAKIKKLEELPPGKQSCLQCVHRSPDRNGAVWRCGAKGPDFCHDLQFDWAVSNNGDCRLYTPFETPCIDLNGDDDLINPGVYVARSLEEEIADEENIDVEHLETYGVADYIEPEEAPVKSSNERYTPPNWINFVQQVFDRPIELDPASCEEANKIVQAQRLFTLEDDALDQDWSADTLFLNPPYSMPEIEQFSIKLLSQVPNIREFIFLVNSCTETSWFQAVANQCNLLLFPSSRINFWSPGTDPHNIKGGNEYRQTLMYRGPNAHRFKQLGQKIGLVVSVK